MEELELECRELVLNNIQSEVDNDVLELIIISVMALVLRHGKMARERLPKILNDLSIFAEHKTLVEISHERLNNYSEDEFLGLTDIGVTRSFGMNEDDTVVQEKRTLIISLLSLNKEKLIPFIEKLVHEFTHLMRFGGITNSDTTISIKDGISTNIFNKETKQVRRKHYCLEEGITQYYTIQSLDTLYEYLTKHDCPTNSFLTTLKKEYPTYQFGSYTLQVQLLKVLNQDLRFSELLDYTFEENKNPSQLALYYNSVMDSVSAFTKFSKLIDACWNARCEDSNELEQNLETLGAELKLFLSNTVSKQKKISLF